MLFSPLSSCKSTDSLSEAGYWKPVVVLALNRETQQQATKIYKKKTYETLRKKKLRKLHNFTEMTMSNCGATVNWEDLVKSGWFSA